MKEQDLKLEDLLNKNDLKEAKALVHAFRGTSGNIGANYLFEKLSELEKILGIKISKDK